MRAVGAICLVVAALAAGVSPAVAAPQLTEVLQYSAQLGTAGHEDAPRRLVARLRGLGLAPRGFEVLPMLAVRGTPAQLRRARALPGVRYHHRADARVVYDLDRSVPLVFRGPAAPVRAAAGEASGVRVAVLDTGVDGLHPHLGPRVAHSVDFVTSENARGPNGMVPLVHVPVVCPSKCNTDVNGHGTHVAGIVAGMGRAGGSHAGMAPGAEIVSVSIGKAGRVLEVLTAMDYVLAHPELRVRVVNNSWRVPTDGFDPTEPIHQATKLLHAAGITVVFSAGNEGQGRPAPGQPAGSSNCIDPPSSTACAFSPQGVAPWTVSVAAGDDVAPGGPGDQHLARTSSRGDPRPHRVAGLDVTYMPTLTAPGTFIVSTAGGSAGAPGGARCVNVTCPGGLVDPLYALMSGTSMAAPHVAGAVALFQSRARMKLGRELTPDEVKSVLVKGAAPMTQAFDEPGTCDRYTGPATGCDPGMCSIVSEALGCKPKQPTGRYARWQVGAGYLDVQGSLRALDELAAPTAVQQQRPPSPQAPAPPAAPAPAPAAPPAALPQPKPPATKTAVKRAAKKKKSKARKRKTTKRGSSKARRGRTAAKKRRSASARA